MIPIGFGHADTHTLTHTNQFTQIFTLINSFLFLNIYIIWDWDHNVNNIDYYYYARKLSTLDYCIVDWWRLVSRFWFVESMKLQSLKKKKKKKDLKGVQNQLFAVVSQILVSVQTNKRPESGFSTRFDRFFCFPFR